jgi:hypothetical protein
MPQFTDKEWKEALGHLATVIGAEADRYAKVPAAKLTAAIPYLAGSEDPDRFAVSNLLTLHAATKARALFNHRPGDDEDIFRRLAAFHVGNHADPKIVDHGLTLLALISLGDHEHDAAADKKAGKYNPLNSGKWDAKALRKELETDLAKSPGVTATYSAIVDPSAMVGGAWV